MCIPLFKYRLHFPLLIVVASVCFLLMSGLVMSQSSIQAVRWETDLNLAKARAEQEQRPLFLHFVGNDSPTAQPMQNEVFANPNIASHLNAHFVMVKINAVENQALAQRFSVTAIPTDLIMRPNEQVIHRRVGAIPVERFAEFLAFLQQTIQPDTNQASTPPPAMGSFPVTASQNPPQSVPAPGTMSSGVVPPGAMPQQTAMNPAASGVARDPFPQSSPGAQYPPFAQQPQTVAGAVTTALPVNNPLRGSETAIRSTQEQNPASVSPPTSQIQAMLAAPAPPKMMIEVPLALEGFCPVMLCAEECWVTGNPAYCTLYQGHIFRFSSPEALITFAKNPANYTPVAMGEDIVLQVDRNRRVNGNRKFGAWFHGRVFLFAGEETFEIFRTRPDYYAEIALKYETARREQPSPIVY